MGSPSQTHWRSFAVRTEVKPRLLDLRLAARYLGLSVWTIRGMTHRGELPFVRAGRSIRIDLRDLEDWIETHKEQS